MRNLSIFFGKYYNEEYKNEYWNIIEKGIWDQSDLENLFKWKNNMREGEKSKLAPTKMIFVNKVAEKLPWINERRNDVTLFSFRHEMKNWIPYRGLHYCTLRS